MNTYICRYYQAYRNSTSLKIIEIVSTVTEALALGVCLITHSETEAKYWTITNFDNSTENNVNLVYEEDSWD